MEKLLLNPQYKKYVIRTQQQKISFKEHKSEYRAYNNDKKTIYLLTIDKGLIKSNTKKCDNGVCILNESKLFLIELKGCDVETAYKQLDKTCEWFNSNTHNLNSFHICFRIVPSHMNKTIDLNMNKKRLQIKWKNKVKSMNFKIGSKMEENI